MSLTKVSYSMINGPVVNAADYGWSATASAAVNYAAIKAAYDSNAAIIQLPAGTFAMAQTFVLGRGVILNGAGAQDGSGNNGQSPGVASTVINYTGTGNAIEVGATYTEQVSNIHISNLMITGNVLADGGLYIGILTGADKCTFKNIGIFGFTNATANKGYGIGIKNCIESIFENVYVHGCNDGFNLGFGACTSLEFRSCYSRVNNQYGWLIRQGNGMSLYQCIAEGNLKTGLVINTRTGGVVADLSFYSWYSEANAQLVTTSAGLTIGVTGTGTAGAIYFYSPIFYDNSSYAPGGWTNSCIGLSKTNNVKFIAATVSSVETNWMSATADTHNCFWNGVGDSDRNANIAISGNVYDASTGKWNVQLNPDGPEIVIGTWTPSFFGGTGTGTGTGTYQKFGTMVTVTGSMNITALSTTAIIRTLPFEPIVDTSGSCTEISTSIYAIGTVFRPSIGVYISFTTSYTGVAATINFSATYPTSN